MLDISIHDCKGLRAVFQRTNNTCCWIQLRFIDGQGDFDEVTVFFQSESYARGLTEAINSTLELAIALEIT